MDTSVAVAKPFQPTRAERRSMLSRHFGSLVERLVGEGQPYADLSVEQIITAGGISRSTFYSYFEDKGDLLAAMASDVIDELIQVGNTWWELGHGAGKAELREALRSPIRSYRDHGAMFATIVEAAAYDGRAREQQLRLINHVTAALAEHIVDSQRAGRADPTLDAHRGAAWIIWMLERGMYQMLVPAHDEEMEEMLTSATDLVWRMLYAGYRAE